MSERVCACGQTPDPGICQPGDCALRRATGSHCSCIHPPFGDVGREADAYQKSRRADDDHWLLFSPLHHVTGCHCGFRADKSDQGFGDSVVRHLIAVGKEAECSTDRNWMKLDGSEVPCCRFCGTEGGDCGFVCC